jgi:hypothetical protein
MIKNAPKSDPDCFKNIKIPASKSTKKALEHPSTVSSSHHLINSSSAGRVGGRGGSL